jgi:hypothetical protein
LLTPPGAHPLTQATVVTDFTAWDSIGRHFYGDDLMVRQTTTVVSTSSSEDTQSDGPSGSTDDDYFGIDTRYSPHCYDDDSDMKWSFLTTSSSTSVEAISTSSSSEEDTKPWSPYLNDKNINHPTHYASDDKNYNLGNGRYFGPKDWMFYDNVDTSSSSSSSENDIGPAPRRVSPVPLYGIRTLKQFREQRSTSSWSTTSSSSDEDFIQPNCEMQSSNEVVMITSDSEESFDSRDFYSCETDDASIEEDSDQESIPDKPITKLVFREPRSLRRQIRENEAQTRTGFGKITRAYVNDDYDYMLPPLPAGYKKKNQGCGWSRDLRPNDKYEYGPKYGVKILKHIVLSEEATEKAKKIWLSVGTGTFDPALMAQGFKLVGKLLYDSNYYSIKHVDCETLKCARQKLALVLTGHRLQRCDFVMRRPIPCKNRALRIWLRNYKFCLRNFCGLKSDRITQYLDELKSKSQAFMQGKEDSESALSFYDAMKGSISKTRKYLGTFGSSATNKVGTMASDTVSTVLNAGTKMMVDSLFKTMYDTCVSSLQSGISNIKSWLTSIKSHILAFMNGFADSVIEAVPIDAKLGAANKSMWACLGLALFSLVTLSWWTSSLASSVFMSIIAFSLNKIGVEVDRKSSKDFIDSIYSDDAVMHGCTDSFGAFGKAFIGLFSLGTVGSVTNIISRMPTVKNNIKDFFMWLIDSIYSLFSKGKHFFPDYQEIDDLGNYMRKCVLFLQTYSSAEIFTNDIASREVMRLGKEALIYRRILALSSGLSSATHTYYNNVLVRIEKLSSDVKTQAWVTQARIEPTWFSMYGKPGQGKSETYSIMPKHVYDRVSAAMPTMYPQVFSQAMVYEKAASQAYCDGYDPEKHFTFAIEELAAMADPKMRGEEFGLMQKIVSRAPLPLTMAELSAKNNTFYASPFVVTSTNVTDDEIESGSGLSRPTTIFRRRHFHVEVMRAPNHGVPDDQLLSRPDECWIYRMHYTPSRGMWIKLALRGTGVDFSELARKTYIDFTFSQLADLIATRIINEYKRSATDRSFYKLNFGQHFGPGALPPPPPPPNTSASTSSSSDEFYSSDGGSSSSEDSDFDKSALQLAQECEDLLEEKVTVQSVQKAFEPKQDDPFDRLPPLETFEVKGGDEYARLTNVFIETWHCDMLTKYLENKVAGVRWFQNLPTLTKQQVLPFIHRPKKDDEGFRMRMIDRIYKDAQFLLFGEYHRINLTLHPLKQRPLEVPTRLRRFYTDDYVLAALAHMISGVEMQGSGSSEDTLEEWEEPTTTTTVTSGDYTDPKIEDNPRFIKWDTRRIIADKWLDL